MQKINLRRANFIGTNFGGESEDKVGIHFPHTPFSARLARVVGFSAAPAARHQSSPKKVRAKCIITAPESDFRKIDRFLSCHNQSRFLRRKTRI
jgi:hypothetical protein